MRRAQWACTDSAGGPSQCVEVAVNTKRSQTHQLAPERVKHFLANERQEFTSHLGVVEEIPLCRRCSNSQSAAGSRGVICAAFLPLSQLCHCRVKNFLGQRKRQWIFPWSLWHLEESWIFMSLTFCILVSDFWCILYKQISKSFILYLLLDMSQFYNAMGWQNWNDFSCHLMSYSFFSDAAALYIYRNNCFLGNGLEGWGGKCFPLSRFMGATLLWLIVSVWTPKQRQEEKGGGERRQTEIWENKLFNKYKLHELPHSVCGLLRFPQEALLHRFR